MFSQTNYMEQDSTKNHLTLGKTNRVSNRDFCAKCMPFIAYTKIRVKNIIPLLF